MKYSHSSTWLTTTFRLFFAVTYLFIFSIEAAYIERFSTIDNGSIVFTGNALGLSKCPEENNPGANDSIGAYMTTNSKLQVNNYPPGTTLNVHENSSSAILDLPLGSVVLYAELIWSGSYGWPHENPAPPPADDVKVTLTTPQMITHTIKADKLTAQNDVTPGFTQSGNYVRSANVTSIVQLGGGGAYIAGQIPSTVDKHDESHNAAGWTLAVVYRNPMMYTHRMCLWVGCEQGYQSKALHTMDDFITPSSGVKNGCLFISAIEGDAVRSGDHLLFGSDSNLIYPENALVGTNNPIDNFFGSQINTLLPLHTDKNDKLVPFGSGQLDTRGTFGFQNHNIHNRQNILGGRQGYDITSIDLSEKIHHNQTVAYVQGQTLMGDEDYTIGALGLQFQVQAPIIKATKLINSKESIYPPAPNDPLSVKIILENSGTTDAKQLLIKKLIQNGLNYVPSSFKINGSPMPDRYIELVPVGDLAVNQSITIEYQVTMDSSLSAKTSGIKGTLIDYQFLPWAHDTLLGLTASTNTVAINR